MATIDLVLENFFNKNRSNITVVICRTGDVNTSYIASYGEKKIFIKIQDKVDLPAFYSGQIERDVAGLKICKENNIPCPSVLQYDYTQNFIVTEYIEHPILSQVWSELSVSQKANMKQSALDILGKLSSVKSLKFGAGYHSKTIKQFVNWQDCYHHLIEVAVEDCLFYEAINKKEATAILEATKENATHLSDSETAHFNHLDFHWNNVFVKDKDGLYEIAGIIDFGSSLYVPAYMDMFRLDDGFLYGTEKFYTHEIKPYEIDNHQLFCADLLNTIDYFVFLSFTNQMNTNVKLRLINMCRDYLLNVR